MAGDSIKFNASLNTAAFESGAKKLGGVAASAASGISQHFGKIAMAVAGITAAFLGVRAAAQSFHAAIAMGGQLNDLSARTGETAGNLAILQRAFQNAGAGAEAVGPTINRLQRAIVEAGEGSKTYANAFQKLGLDLNDLKTKTPTEQLRAVAEAIKGIKNPSDQTAIAMQILGRSGGELMPLLKAMGGEFDRAGQQLGSLPGIIDRTNEHLDRIGDNFKAIGEKGKEFMVGLLEKLAPGLADLTDRLANIDAAGFGAKLSEYAQKTVEWITETFKLKGALDQVETAIKGITSGNFGDGLKLMFLTARDTALNAINTIVAAASAAVESVSGAVSNMFRSEGPLVLLLKTSFTIAANYLREALYNALADFMDAIGRSGMADAFRYQAETAARSIEMLTKGIGSQIELVGEDAKETFAGIPDAFGKAYKANMERPLFDMKDRAAETADQMERVAAATRAAAFDAESFGQALRDARLEKFTGGAAESPFPAGTRGDGASMAPPAGSSSSSARGTSTRAGGLAASSADPLTRDQQLAKMRADAASQRNLGRVSEFMDRGAFGSALAAQERAQRAADRILDRQGAKDFAREMYGGRDMAESFKNFRDEMKERGGLESTFGISRKDFERWAKEQAKTKTEREREEKQTGEAAGGGKGSDPFSAVSGQLDTIIKEITERLPQHAMS
jgi:hypothetical protein